MFEIRGVANCLGAAASRRKFLRVSSLSGLGLLLPHTLCESTAAESADATFGRAKRCLMLYLTGGPPQIDTWDPKPDAPVEIRGEFRPIATDVPGVQISEVFPSLARRADRYCIVRSVTHGDNTHASAAYAMLTGSYHPLANARSSRDVQPTLNDHPHPGSLLTKVRTWRNGVPVFASLPELLKDGGQGTLIPGQDAGFLGKGCDPFRVEGDPDTVSFQMPALALPPEMSTDRLAARRALRERLDREDRSAQRPEIYRDVDSFWSQGFDALHAPAMRAAFDLDREPERQRTAYGSHLFGQSCLLARRLLEAGVALVTVYWPTEGPEDSPQWDTHQNNFVHLRSRLAPPTDQAIAALLEDLSTRGLLEETLIVCLSEFGRSPRVNKLAGRDHWARVQSVMLAGAGVRCGRAYGASDRTGGYPLEHPVTPPDLTATILHLLGVRPDMELRERNGRPLRACEGTVVRGLLG